jgi:hypothetical protein
MGYQGFSGFVLQVFVGGSGDLDWQVLSLSLQVAGTFNQNSEHDLSHAGVDGDGSQILPMSHQPVGWRWIPAPDPQRSGSASWLS